ncbi:Ca-activated chloride channel family protein [Sulfurivirga caldicuralii]|uniref:Ca-activated chloride channel family protein n=1 Tax=Sulfurivirga caldicuralii TaxID=364032 RepID=A0A1N6HD15_9GAMM|nr:VWA domain-containing protein [Sulfurivirga caldicuralii]SIO17559.1 Ca-activated chloride channel family protein [Sulfurivirga caldicuralii]
MSWDSLHFLRPLWLIALLPSLLLWWGLLRRQHPLGRWAAVIEERILRLLQLETGTPPQRWPLHGLLVLWTLAVLALSGPTVSQVSVPAHKTRTGTVIVFDLSLSMLAQDVPPSRLVRARYKLLDLLERTPQQKYALVVYAGSAHVMLPISDDTATLHNLVPSLSPTLMPRLGSRPDLAMEQADALLRGAQIERGHIIWITDDLDREQALRNFFKSHDYSLAILAVGTPEGAPIPLPNGQMLKDRDGKLVIARLPWARLQAFAREVNAVLTPLTLDDSDIERIRPPFAVGKAQDAAETVRQWQDLGPWLVLLVALGSALLFRRGWVFVLLTALPVLHPLPVFAQADNDRRETSRSDWRDIFRTPDQQAYQQWQLKHYDLACDLFENPRWKAAACYRAGRLKDAQRALRNPKSAEDFYNLGNILARQHRYAEALRQYEKALSLRPDFGDAKANAELMRRLLRQQQAPQSQTNGNTPSAQQSNPNTPQQKPEKRPPPPQNRPQPAKKPAQTPSPQAAKKPPEKKSGTPPAGGQKAPAQPGTRSTRKANQDGSPDKAVTVPANPSAKKADNSKQLDTRKIEPWLQQVPDEPGLYFQRKFEYQLQQKGLQQEEDKAW